MDAASWACAPSGSTWNHCRIRRLQASTVKAIQEGRPNKVKALRGLLPHSFSSKTLAARRVTENRGQNHAPKRSC